MSYHHRLGVKRYNYICSIHRYTHVLPLCGSTVLLWATAAGKSLVYAAPFRVYCQYCFTIHLPVRYHVLDFIKPTCMIRAYVA